MKSPEPEKLTAWKRKFKNRTHRQARYTDLKDENVKNDLKMHLVTEQKNVCGYCCTPIIDIDSHIEHIRPQSRREYVSLSLDYTNLMASCLPSQKNDHCGHFKADNFDENLFISPYDEDCEKYFEYSEITGEIQAAGGNERAVYMIDLLNLNEPRLKQARLTAIWEADIMDMSEEELKNYKKRIENSDDIPYADAQLFIIRKCLNHE